jgi:spermidine/putrescine transport system permease protein
VDEGRRTKAWVPWLLLGPGFVWLLLFFALPLVMLLVESLDDSRRTRRLGGGGLKNYTQVFEQYDVIIFRTFAYSAIATLICIAIGYPLAYFIAMKGGRWKSVLIASVVLPFFTTYLIRTIAWRVIVDHDGPLVALLRAVNLLRADGELLATPVAVIFALAYNYLPFMVLPIYVSLEKINRGLLEAGPDLYASGARTFRKITLPLSLPGLFAGTLLTFIPASGDFVNSELLGSDRTRMIGNIIERNFLQEQFRPGISALSFVLMALILVAVLGYARILGTEELV